MCECCCCCDCYAHVFNRSSVDSVFNRHLGIVVTCPSCLPALYLLPSLPACLSVCLPLSLLDFNLLNYSQFASFARLFEYACLCLCLCCCCLPGWQSVRVVCVCVLFCLYCTACVTVTRSASVYIAFRFVSYCFSFALFMFLYVLRLF